MNDLEQTATTFIEIAHRIVWATVATVDRRNRPRSRVLHPFWEWDGEALTGWVGTSPTALKRAHLRHSPHVSCSYWSPEQDTCVAECRAALLDDDATRVRVWNAFEKLESPVGYDPATMPPWKDGPTSPGFAVLRLEPWRLRVLRVPDEPLVWHEG